MTFELRSLEERRVPGDSGKALETSLSRRFKPEQLRSKNHLAKFNQVIVLADGT